MATVLFFIDARPKVSSQVCHNASALQGCQFPEPQIDGHYLSTERQNGLGYDPGNPGRLSTALIETNTVEPVRICPFIPCDRQAPERCQRWVRPPGSHAYRRLKHAGLHAVGVYNGAGTPALKCWPFVRARRWGIVGVTHRRQIAGPFAGRNNYYFYFPPLSNHVCPTTSLKTRAAFTAQQTWFATLGYAWAGHRRMSAPK